MPYEIGLDLRFSQLHTCFSPSFADCLVCSSLSVTASQLSLWTLSFFTLLFCQPPVAFGCSVIAPFYLSQSLLDNCSNCAATSESLKAKGQRSGCSIHRGTSGVLERWLSHPPKENDQCQNDDDDDDGKEKTKLADCAHLSERNLL